MRTEEIRENAAAISTNGQKAAGTGRSGAPTKAGPAFSFMVDRQEVNLSGMLGMLRSLRETGSPKLRKFSPTKLMSRVIRRLPKPIIR